MSAERCFFDTNILAYTLEATTKADIAEGLLKAGGTISVQVLNELTNVARRKHGASWHDINAVLDIMKLMLDVVPVTVAIHDAGVRLAERYQLAVYDAMIVAAALESGCDVLWSEDMQHGMRIGGMSIRNPFV